MAPAYLAAAVRVLAACAQDRCETSEWTARRVGRNTVWEVTAAGGDPVRHFVKFWPAAQMFRRELAGLQVLASLARRLNGLLAPQVVLADEQAGALAVAELRGSSVQRIIAGALRRAVIGRHGRLAEARHGLEQIVRFLNELHRINVPETSDLAAHRPADAVARITRLADRLRSRPLLQGSRVVADLHVNEADFPISALPAECLLHGDPGPGNFLISSSGLAVLDFEDFGVGPSCRDFLWLEYSLEQFASMWRYASARPLIALLPLDDVDPALRLLYRVEFHLIHLTALSHRLESGRGWARLRDQMELRRVLRSLDVLCDGLTRPIRVATCTVPA